MKDRLAAAAVSVQESLFPPDPGLLRLFAALRATLGALLTLLLVMLVGALLPTPWVDGVLGFIIALFTGALVRDAERRQQTITMTMVPLAAIPASAAAAFLLHHELIKAALVPGIIFAATYGAGTGPRWGTVGLIALIAYIIGLVTALPPATLPVRCLVICLAAADAALFRFWVLPANPQNELHRLLRDVRRSIGRLLSAIDAGLAAGTWKPAARKTLQRHLDHLASTMLMAQARLPGLPQAPAGLGLRLLEIELAAERLVRTALHDLGPPDQRAALRRAAAALQTALAVGREPPPLPGGDSILAGALALLTRILREHPSVPPAGPVPVPVPTPVAAQPIDPRPAIQSAIAAILAIVGGELVSPTRWYWAAFAAFVTFQGTRSRGESIAKVTQFMAGTVAGVVGGVLAAVLLSGHPGLTVALIILAVFLAFQAAQAAYGVMIFWVTIILGLLFGMLGYFAPALLLLRLKETAVGAGCGVLVASAIMVRPGRAVANAAIAALLGAFGPAIDAATRSLLVGAPDPELPATLVEVQSRFLALREAARPELHGLGAARHQALRQRLVLLEGCETWTRELGRISLHRATLLDPALAQTARAAAARIDARLQCLLRGSANLATPADTAPPVTITQQDIKSRPVHLLLRIEATLARLTPSALG